ncbi:hypothetical protein GCM10010331_49620 [Streptomyces xanthochromogenes]|uniref:FDXHR family putative zinc-binding protein n=1 Tax=Streptomyces xanthochromogenes TaxID=67384 RepID=UPI0019AE2B37|nr:hypothetical protein GCM10010331_49620 [Streptomyces xanthochromogenes]
MNAASGPRAQSRTPTAPQSLLTKTLPAGKGNSVPTEDVTPTPIPPNAVIHGECGAWWTGTERSHASCCHRTFSSLSAFDQHRKGLRCNNPEDVGLIAREKPFGTLWGWPAPVGGYGALRRDDAPTEAAA